MLLLLVFCLIFPYYKHYTFLIISILTQKVHLYTKQKNKSPFLNGLSFVLIMWALRSNLPLQLYCSAHVYYDIVFTNEDFFNECFLSSVETFVTKSMVSPALWVQSNEVSCEKGTSSCSAVCCEPNLRDDDTAENQQALGWHGLAFRWLMSSSVWLRVKPPGWPEHWCQGKGGIEQDCVVLKLGWPEAFCHVSVSVLKELGMCCSCLFCMISFPQSFTYQIIDKYVWLCKKHSQCSYDSREMPFEILFVYVW